MEDQTANELSMTDFQKYLILIGQTGRSFLIKFNVSIEIDYHRKTMQYILYAQLMMCNLFQITHANIS
jgi:hypothetical protein